jgi:hypothetical protein
MTLAAGCVAPKKVESTEGPRKETPGSKETPIDKAKEDEPQPQKQETLAAVEEFLARTQDYRLPAKSDAKLTSPESTASIQTGITETAPIKDAPVLETPPRDATVANAQVSIGEPAAAAPSQPIPAVESISIKPTPSKSAPRSGNSHKATNRGMETRPSTATAAADSLVEEFRDELKERKDPLSEWKLRMLLLALGRDAEAASVSEAVPPEMAGVLPALGSAAASIRDAVRNPADDSDSAMEHIDALRSRLADAVGPRVSNVALCRKVTTFGAYEEMAADEFISGRSVQTIVYAEIENLRSNPQGSGSFETRLSTRLELWSADGKSMWQREEPEVIDRCRKPRRDFFVAQRITLPPTLPEGEYVLRVTVEDKASRMISDGSVSLRLGSPISVAKGQ